MLIHLLPEQVNSTWKFLAPVIQKGLPPTQTTSYQNMVRVLASILAERAVVWRIVPSADQEARTQAVLVTTVYSDPVVMSRHLLIYAFTALENLTEEDWVENFKGLRKYADVMGVSSIIAYSKNKTLIDLAEKRLGATVEYSLLEFD